MWIEYEALALRSTNKVRVLSLALLPVLHLHPVLHLLPVALLPVMGMLFMLFMVPVSG